MTPSSAAERLTQISDDAPAEIAKMNAETRAWRIAVRGEAQFVKFYPNGPGRIRARRVD